MIPGAILCDIPESILDTLGNHFKKFTIYKPNIVNGDYKQWFVQTASRSNIIKNEDNLFTEWLDNGILNEFKNYFLQYVDGIYRFRYSSMPATHKIDYHQPHKYPRIHIPLNDAKSFFNIDAEKTYEFVLERGKAYVLNVVYPHTVVADTFREHCFFSFKNFANDDLKSKYWLS